MMRLLFATFAVGTAINLRGLPGGGSKGSVTAEKLCGKNAVGCSYFNKDKKDGTGGIKAEQVYSVNVNEKNRVKMTVDFCRDYCFQYRVYHFFVVFRGEDCACFNYDFAGTTAPNDKCNLKCSGDEGEICGGTDAGNVYKLVKVVPPVEKAKCPGDVADDEKAWKRDDGEAVARVVAKTAMQFTSETDCNLTAKTFERVAKELIKAGKKCHYMDKKGKVAASDAVGMPSYSGRGNWNGNPCYSPSVDTATPGQATLSFGGSVKTGAKPGGGSKKGTQYATQAGPNLRTVWTELDSDSGIEFGWKGIAGGDWFEFIAVFEKKSDDEKKEHEIIDSLWMRAPRYEWQQTVFENKAAGKYRVSFLLASFDGSGGGWLGASLSVRNFMIKLKNVCSVGSGILPVAEKSSEFCRCGDRGAMCGSTKDAKRACMDCGEKQCLVKAK